MGDGLGLALGCSYINDVALPFTTDITIEMGRQNIENEPGKSSEDIAFFRMFTDGRASIGRCQSNWENVCDISFDEAGDQFAGSLNISHPSYDSSVETGYFRCAVTVDTKVPKVNIKGNSQNVVAHNIPCT